MRRLWTVVLVGAVVLLTGGSTYATKNWTVMVYMAADNNLEAAAIDDLNEMERIGSTSQVDIVVQIDRIPGYDNSNDDWTTTRRYHVTQDADTNVVHSTLVADLGEKNMGDPATLSQFVDWAMTNHPATHYFLVIWDHGAGWQKQVASLRVIPGAEGSETVATAKQIKHGNEISPASQATQFPPPPFGRAGFKSAGVDMTDGDELFNYETQAALASHPKLDVIGFDACFMAMVETAYQLRDEATYLVASEELEPGDGWAYDDFLGYLAANPTYTPAQVCSLAVLTYSNYWTGGPDNKQTLSAIDLTKIRTVASAVDGLVNAIVGGSSWPQILAMPMPEQFGGSKPFRDLYDFADLVSVNVSAPAIVAAANSLKTAVSSAVLINRTEVGHPYAHGLSVYFPQTIASLDLSYLITPVTFADSTVWPTFLSYYWGGGTFVLDIPEPNDVPTQAGLPLDPAYVYSSYISTLTDNDWYLINSGVPESILMTLKSPPNADLDLRFYAADGVTLLDSSAHRGNGVPDTIAYSAPGAQYYYLNVRGFNSFSTSPYEIHCDQVGNGSGSFLLSYDDGVPDGGYYSANTGDVLGSAFSLRTYPMVLDRVWIHFSSLSGGGGGDGSFYLLLYDNYGYVIDPLSLGPLTPADTGWSFLDLTARNPEIYTDLFVGVWYDGANTPVIGNDPVSSGRDYFYSSTAQTWMYLEKSLFFRLDVSSPKPTGVFDTPVGQGAPVALSLYQNYPNPFNASTVISYETRSVAPITLEIFNILGQRVFARDQEVAEPGRHSFAWNGIDQSGTPVPSGLYLYRVSAGGVQQTRKMVLLK